MTGGAELFQAAQLLQKHPGSHRHEGSGGAAWDSGRKHHLKYLDINC